MYRYLASILLILAVVLVSGSYFFKQYWEHRYDELIARHARVYRIDDALVWSIIWEETYFQAWKIGADQEVGLMQVMPSVARQWAAETGLRQFEEQTAADPSGFLLDPERNIQIGSWYFEKVRERYRGRPAETARRCVWSWPGSSGRRQVLRAATGAPWRSGGSTSYSFSEVWFPGAGEYPRAPVRSSIVRRGASLGENAKRALARARDGGSAVPTCAHEDRRRIRFPTG